MEANEKIWFLAKEDLIPDDYREVTIKSQKVPDPNGNRRPSSDGKFPTAMIWIVDLTRGGVTVESPEIWSHHPPIDVAIFHLELEGFKQLLGRLPDSREASLRDPNLPKPPQGDFLGKRFDG